MRRTLTLIFPAALLCSAVIACGQDKGVEDKMAKARAQDEERLAAEAKAKQAAADKKEAKRLAEEKQREAETARLKANAAPGNKLTTDEVARDDDDRAILAELAKSDTFEGVAKRVKAKAKHFKPLIYKALQHEESNVRVQAARIMVINKWSGEEASAAWKTALMNEASDIVRENWGYDLRLYKDPALMEAAHKAFTRSSSPAALGNLGETLMEMKYKPALSDIQHALEKTDDTMTRVFLLSALKRMPDPSSQAFAEKHLVDDQELVRTKARQVLDAIENMPPAAEAKQAPGK